MLSSIYMFELNNSKIDKSEINANQNTNEWSKMLINVIGAFIMIMLDIIDWIRSRYWTKIACRWIMLYLPKFYKLF
jgi:hypothetical protein